MFLGVNMKNYTIVSSGINDISFNKKRSNRWSVFKWFINNSKHLKTLVGNIAYYNYTLNALIVNANRQRKIKKPKSKR